METTRYPFRAALQALATALCLVCSHQMALSQTPTITVRFANPTFDCAGQYCVDVEFISDTAGVEVFGMNVRFFYPDTILEFIGFTDYQGGYGAASPDPPIITTGDSSSGMDLFNFAGPAEFVNGAIQLIDNTSPILLDTATWTKLFSICLQVDSNVNLMDSFCPPLIWDLEADPANGGFLAGDDGVVITIVDPDPNIESAPTTENVVQFNWMYTGDGSAPYGEPVEEQCISINCVPMIVCPADVTIDCNESTIPDSTGLAIVTDICPGDIIITIDDTVTVFICPGNFVILRTFIATNDCNLADTCTQSITVTDTIAPTIICTGDTIIDCPQEPDFPLPIVSDQCDTSVTIMFSDSLVPGPCPAEYTVTRTWIATDDCGNSSSCSVTIAVQDTTAPVITCPLDTIVDCTSPTDIITLGTATATDLCDTLVLITFTDVTVAGSCPQEYTITRTWTATDDCLNTSNCDQIITVQDTTAPVITCPLDTIVDCTSLVDTATLGAATAIDVCDTLVAIMFADVTVAGTCPQEYTITRTWTATDDCLNSSTCDQIITVQDTTAPVITCPLDTIVDCTSPTDTATLGAATAIDNCDTAVTVTFADVNVAGACPQEYTILRTWTATDDCLNSDVCVQTIIVQDTTAPLITCPLDTIVDCTSPTDTATLGAATVVDLCDTSLLLTFVDVTVAGACPQEYTITRTWIATDDCLNTSTCDQVITVQDTMAPVIACPEDVTLQCTASTLPNSTIPGMATADDDCDSMLLIVPSDITIASLTCTQEYTILRTWSATDDCGNTSTCLQTIIVVDTIPPLIDCPEDLTLYCADSIPTTPAVATDDCGGIDSTGFSDVVCDNPVIGFNGDYNFANWTIIIPPQGGSVTTMGDSEVMLVSADSGSCTDAATMFLISIPSTGQLVFDWNYTTNDIDGPNYDPFGYNLNGTFFQLTDDNGADMQSGTASVFVTAGDNFAFEQRSEDCIFGEGATTVIEFYACTDDTAEVCNQLIIRTHIAIDDCGNESSCIQTILVVDTIPPVIVCPADTIVDCTSPTDTLTLGAAQATDDCDTTLLLTYIDSLIPGTCPFEYNILRTWTATDNCGNTNTCLQNISVQDNDAPELECPDDVTIECTASTLPGTGIPGMATAIDSCDSSPDVSYEDLIISSLICPQEYTIIRTWTATDSCGNSSSCAQTIIVDDSTPPVITCPTDIIMECSDTIPTTLATATDNCTDTVILGYTDIVCDNPIMGFTDVYDFSNWTITIPAEGGSVTPMGDMEVMLVSPNNFSCSNASVVMSIMVPVGSQIVFDWNYTTADVDGPSYDPFGYSINGTFVQLTDDQGSDTQSGTVSIPVNSGDVFAFEQRSDDCILGSGATSVVEFFACAPMDEEICSQLIIRTHTATDDCGNSSSCIQTILIEDTTPPEIMCPPDTLFLVLDSTLLDSAGFATAIDSCGSVDTIYFEDAIVESLCDSSFVVNRTWTAVDGCGNSSTCLQVIMMLPEDTTTFVVDAIACLDHINLSIDNDCGTVLMSGMILTGDYAGDNSFTVIIKDINGNIIPDATFTFEHVGQTFTVMVVNECSGQSCWGYVTVEDKLGPIIDCVCPVGNEGDSCIISCLQIADFLEGNIPAEVRPTVVDNCGGATLEVTNVELNFEVCFGGSLIVSWLGTDAFGNTSTCRQEFIIEPLTLDSLVFPPDFTGDCDQSSDPSVTGWPQVEGIDLSNIPGHCNILATYTDSEHPMCGGGRKILRTWRVFDWCVPETREFVQFITLADRSGPVLTCAADVTVGTDVWFCYANINVPRPIAVDACSEIKTYHLFSPAGTVVQTGNNFRINALPIGSHIITWTVSDECHNSSSCTTEITVIDNVPPVLACKQHLIVSLTNDRPNGTTLVPAEAFNDGSQDNCSAVTFRARRMTSCFEEDWTTGGACVDDIPGGGLNGNDFGTAHGICVPFFCCDIGAGPIMVELEVTDASGNVNYCMVTVEVQDKLAPEVICPPDVTLSCEFPYNFEEGVYSDFLGNHNGSLDEDPLSAIFGNVYDAFRYDSSARNDVIINDPGNDNFAQPHIWGIDGWATDNCEVSLEVIVSIFEDCSGNSLPGDAPAGAVRLITRRFTASDGSNNIGGTCLQRIWIVDFDQFYIADQDCNNEDPFDGVIWPCDVTLNECPEELSGTGEPIILDDECSIVGVSFEDERFDFADGGCYKILREWTIIDWCQFDVNTGSGIWRDTQIIKVVDIAGPAFLSCPVLPVELCLDDPGITLPANNQAFLGEDNPESTSCSVHVSLSQTIQEFCSESVIYDVKIYLFNSSEFIQIKPATVLQLGLNHQGVMSFNTAESNIQDISENGLPYNDALCGDYHRVVWTVEDGCGNQDSCDYLFRLEDCKAPTPVCFNGLSSVVMGSNGEVTIWASDFDASSFDDCTYSGDLLFSFSGTEYQPSFTYTCDNVPEFGVPIAEEIWVADEGADQNCNGQIEWSERNKDFCVTFIIITDNQNVCDENGLVLDGEIETESSETVSNVMVNLTSPDLNLPGSVTADDGKFSFANLPLGLDYILEPARNDDHKNGVSTLDLVRIQKHLLGKEVFTSPYQYIAADANKSNSVSAIDLLEIRKLILGIYQEYPDNTSWRFVKKDQELVPGNPWPFDEKIRIDNLSVQMNLNLDFTGVKIGDVNNTVKAHATQILPRSGNQIVSINGSMNGEIRKDEVIEVRLVIPEIVSGFQWTLETDGLEYIGTSSNDIHLDENNIGVLSNDLLTMSWNGQLSENSRGKNEISISIQFKVIEAGRIDQMVLMNSSITQAEAYTIAGEIKQTRLAFEHKKQANDFALYQNKPNPWNGMTTIGFDLPADASVTLTVYDVASKVINTITGEFRAGYNTIILNEKDIPGTGVLYYRLESGEYAATKKMVLIR